MDSTVVKVRSKIIPTGDEFVKTIICTAIVGVAGLVLGKAVDLGYDKAFAKFHTKPTDPQT